MPVFVGWTFPLESELLSPGLIVVRNRGLRTSFCFPAGSPDKAITYHLLQVYLKKENFL
jgi:hypothetical protein